MGGNDSHLSDNLNTALGLTGEEPPVPKSIAVDEYFRRHEDLADIPAEIIRKAWFTMAHLILEPGARVANMSCQDGMMSYVMAALNPDIHITGVDIDKKVIRKAAQKYKLPNLDFVVGDAADPGLFEKNSLDAIINSFILHIIYSESKYNERPVVQALENQFSFLKKGGIMFIRDYAMPPPGEYVLLEMPDATSRSQSLEDLSEAELLVWYSEHARPREESGCHGFFLEELPPRYPQTRLFRLPYKWAYEFMTRKHDRKNWKNELPKEYTFFTQREYRKNLRALGARVLYTAPHWDQVKIRENYEGHFLLYDDNGKPLGPPPTSFIAVAQKMDEKESLRLHERRPSNKGGAESRLKISAMRNDVDGRLVDIVSRDLDITEILPYRVTPDGKLHVFVHESLPRGIVNAVPRSGKEIDGKRWSGHMTEAIAVDSHAIVTVEDGGLKETVKFARDYLGLHPAQGSEMEKGLNFYPAPDYIDERIQTRYLRVKEHEGRIKPRKPAEDLDGFTSIGHIREINAQTLLNALAVGFIPNVRLELQIQNLYEMLDMEYETWSDCPLVLHDDEPQNIMERSDMLALIEKQDKRFREVRGTSGKIRSVRSIFVDEGRVDGALAGMVAKDIDFIVSDDKTVNTAVVLPLTKSITSGDVMAGVVTEYLPVPQRHNGSSTMLRAPSFTLPKEVTDIESAKLYIADKYGVSPEDVFKLGEGYFCHAGITQQKIFPFAIATSGNAFLGDVTYIPLWYIRYMGCVWGTVLDYSADEHFLGCMKKAYQRIGYDNELNLKNELGQKMIAAKGFNRTIEAHDVRGRQTRAAPLPAKEKTPQPPAAMPEEKKPAPENKQKAVPREPQTPLQKAHAAHNLEHSAAIISTPDQMDVQTPLSAEDIDKNRAADADYDDIDPRSGKPRRRLDPT